MVFSSRREGIIIFGDSLLSFRLAERLSLDYDVILLYKSDNINYEKLNDGDFICEKAADNSAYSIINNIDENTNYFLGLTDSDQNNIYTAWLARNYGIENSFAGIRDNYNFVNSSKNEKILDLNKALSNLVLQDICLCIPIRLDIIADNKLYIIKTDVNDNKDFLEKKVDEVDAGHKGKVVYIKRKERYFVPERKELIRKEDIIYFLINYNYIERLKYFNTKKFNNRIIIYSEKNYGMVLYNKLSNNFKQIVIINSSKDECNFLAKELKDPLILYGEGDDIALLRNAGLNKKTIFISASRSDQRNLLSSYMARSLNCENVYTLLHQKKSIYQAELLELPNRIDVFTLTANFITDKVFFANSSTDYILIDNIRINNQKVSQKNSLIDRRLKDVEKNLPDGIIIAGLSRNGKFLFSKENIKIIREDILFFVYQKNRNHYMDRSFFDNN